MRITLNSDMGEGFGIYDFGNDAGLMRVIDIANVACGFHASDFNHMRKTVRMARENGVQVGAHVSLPDLQGFGRREMRMARQDLVNCIVYQTGALCGFLFAEDLKLNHIKAHGALWRGSESGLFRLHKARRNRRPVRVGFGGMGVLYGRRRAAPGQARRG